jgi:hypothetical protein
MRLFAGSLPTNEKGATTMKKARILVMAGIVGCFAFLGIDAAGAAGGGGESFCSNSGAPTGGAPDTFGNPGELISWIARNVGHSGTNHPGPFVAGACNPVFGTPPELP